MAALDEPRHRLLDEGDNVGALVVGDDGDARHPSDPRRVDEELAVALAAEDRRVDPAAHRAPGAGKASSIRCADLGVDGGIADDAPAATDHGAPGLELRLDQQHHRCPRLAQHASTGITTVSEMNETSATAASTGPPIVGDGRRADVRPFEHGHPLVVADARVELAVADVEGDDLGGAALEQAVGEPSGRGATVEHAQPGDVDGEVVECGIELLAAAADEARRRAGHREVVDGGDEVRRLAGDSSVDEHP